MKKIILLLACFLSTYIYSTIEIDGKLDEPEWDSAKEINQFYEIFPYSLKDADFSTKVLIKETDQGIFFGFSSSQKKDTIRANQHQRDAHFMRTNADLVGVAIDFDGNALTAFDFYVSAGGSIGDAIIKNEQQFDGDWDGDWLSATSISDDHWYAEIFIPWSIAPMRIQRGELRKVKIAMYRVINYQNRMFGSVKASPNMGQFVSKFEEFTFKNYKASALNFYPYVTLSNDRLTDQTETKTGMEIFWKLDSSKQLNATFNPDFGHVESDEVVVNFSAVETYYSDKRPFFAATPTLFNVQDQHWYIINTRRIGGTPDYNCSKYEEETQTLCSNNQQGSSDIDLALSYTQQNEAFDIGVLGAFEDDANFSQGKDFYAVRLRTTRDKTTWGYLGTLVNRPVLNRRAKVNSIDLNYHYSPQLKLTGNLINSIIDSEQGYGFRVALDHTPNNSRTHNFKITYFDKKLDINDMGYMWRNDLMSIRSQSFFTQSDFKKESKVLSRTLMLFTNLRTTANGDKDSSFVGLAGFNMFKDTSGIEFESFYKPKGRDNLITRNYEFSPFVKRSEEFNVSLAYKSPAHKFFHYALVTQREKRELGYGNTYMARLTVIPSETLSLTFAHRHQDKSGWLNWLQENLLGSYDQTQKTTLAELQWFKDNKHELRVKAQMVAFTARDPQAYRADMHGNLLKEQLNLDPFTLSQLAFQVRYRYEMAPLSYFYLVYSRGGQILEFDQENDLKQIYRRSWSDPETDSIVVKLRYKF